MSFGVFCWNLVHRRCFGKHSKRETRRQWRATHFRDRNNSIVCQLGVSWVGPTRWKWVSVVVANLKHVLVPNDAEVVDLVEWEQRKNEKRANRCIAPAKVVNASCIVDRLKGGAVLGRAHPRHIHDFKAAGRRAVEASAAWLGL